MVSILIFRLHFRVKHLMIEAFLFSNKDLLLFYFSAIKIDLFRMVIALHFSDETEMINPEIRELLSTDIIL